MSAVRHPSYVVQKRPQYKAKLINLRSVQFHKNSPSVGVMLDCKAYFRAIAQAVNRWLPTAADRSFRVGFVVDKVALGKVFSEYFGSPANSHSTNCSTVTIYRPGLVQ
jgi:hypothetical protein